MSVYPAADDSANENDDSIVITLSGPITRDTCGALRDSLAPHLGGRLQVALAADARLDIDGLFALAAYQQETGHRGGAMTITAAPFQLEQYIREHNMDQLLDLNFTGHATDV